MSNNIRAIKINRVSPIPGSKITSKNIPKQYLNVAINGGAPQTTMAINMKIIFFFLHGSNFIMG